MKHQLALQEEPLAAFVANPHAAVGDVHVLLQIPPIIKNSRALLTREVLLLLKFGLLP